MSEPVGPVETHPDGRLKSSRLWRQVGFWGLTLNATFGFPVLVVLAVVCDDVDLGLMATIYPILLATWAAAAGIRQWGKANGSET